MMNISEKILAIDWHDYDTAYGNAAEDVPDYISAKVCIPNVAQSLLNLFSDNKKAALQASGNGIQGQATDIKITSDHIQKSKKRLNTILSENTGKSIDEVAIATERDNYMTAKEAMDFGPIDKILTKR